MAESQAHIGFVRKIVDYMSTIIPSYQDKVTQADLAEYGKRTPQVVGGYYPDVYYRTPSYFVIGEAKTDQDIDNHHTNAQISCYIDELRNESQCEKQLILSVSIYSFAMIKNMMVRRKEQENLSDITIHIIDNFGRSAKI